MLTLKQVISISVDPDQWIVYKLKLKEMLMLILSTKRCWKKVKVIDFGLNRLKKKNLNKLKFKDMQDIWNRNKTNPSTERVTAISEKGQLERLQASMLPNKTILTLLLIQLTSVKKPLKRRKETSRKNLLKNLCASLTFW